MSPRRPRRAIGALLVLLTSLALLAWPAAGEEPPLERLLGNLLRAKEGDEVDRALDALALRIGPGGAFADEGAFGDFLGQVAAPAGEHPRVQLRRGWAYIVAGRGRQAVAPLEAAARDARSRPTALAYRGEALRQAEEPARGLEVLTEAARAGYDDPFLQEAALKAAFMLRTPASVKQARGAPPYAAPLEAFLEAGPDAALHATLARWVLDDLAAFELPGSPRANAWAELAGRHALAAVRLDGAVAGGARLALEAAVALEDADRERLGATDRFDLLAWAVRLGSGPDAERHEVPAALAYLADAARREGRYELAYRMARRRLDVSDSPLAREVLLRLPPDVGD